MPQTAKKLGLPWSEADIKRMRMLAKCGVSARVAAQRMGRSRGSVAFKAMKVGVHFRAIAQPAGVQRRRFAKRRATRAA